MILLVHILVALTSIVWTTYLYFDPNKAKIYTAYGLIGGTLASGTALIASTGSSILRGCVSGLIYLAVVSFGVAIASRKLAEQKS